MSSHPEIWTPITADTPRQVDAPLGGRRWSFNIEEARALREAGLVEPDVRVCYFAPDEGDWRLRAIVGTHPDTGRWHLSVAHPERLPTWAEVSDARYRLVPDSATMVMILPPMAEYVNVHQYCFHLHEIPEAVDTAKGTQ